MNFLPIVQRELLVAARGAMVRWQRFGAVAVGVIVFLVVVAVSRGKPKDIGTTTFVALSVLLWLYAWLSGPLHTVDALTRERREATLGLLFLTDLRGYDVVLGKLAATALLNVMLLVGVLPVMAVPLAMGGVSVAEFGRLALTLLLVQGFSLSLGMLCSTLARDFWSSVRTALGVLLTVTLLPPAIQLALDFWKLKLPAALLGTSPALQLLHAFDDYRRLHVEAAPAWSWGVWWLAGGSLVGLSLSALLLRWRRDGEDARPIAANERGRSVDPLHPLTGWRHVHWAAWLEENPYYWLQRTCRSSRRGSTWVINGLAVGAILLAGLACFFPLTGGVFETLIMSSIATGIIAHQCLKLALSLEASRRLGEDRRTGALEMVLTTPLSDAWIVAGCHGALWSWARRHLLLLAMAGIAQAVAFGWVFCRDDVSANDYAFLTMFLAGAAMAWPDTECAIWIGLRMSLREADPIKAFRATVWRILTPGWLAGGLFLLLVSGLQPSPIFAVVLYLVLYLAAYVPILWQTRRARIDLTHGFRAIAAGAGFDTSRHELAEDFRRAAMTWEDRWFTRR